MASILSSLFGQTKLYEPSPRLAHGAAAVGGRCYLWGGRVQDLFTSGRRKPSSTIEIFDPYLETWEEHHTTGVSPPGLYGGACTSLLDSLYWFGGHDGSSYYNSLHRLDTTTLEWKEIQPLNQADGPMRNIGCRMVSFRDKLAVFGGYGIPTGPTQPGAMFTKDTRFTDGRGLSSELHVFTGGVDKNDNTLQDAWILDVNSGRWRELTLPEGAQPRMYHTATALSLGPGWTQVTMFGGCPKWERGKSHNTLQKLAQTTMLDFGSVWSPPSGDRPPTKEWVLVGVADSSQLGSVQRMREKMVDMQERAIREVEAGRQALQVAQSQQALDQRVQDAEVRARDLQTQLEASQDACQELLQSLHATQQSLEASQQSNHATQADKQALERALQESQLQERDLQERVTTAEQSTQEAEQRAAEAERRAHEAQERGREEPDEGEPSWLVHREEINLTEEELGRGGWGVVKVATFRGARIAAKCLYGALNYGYWQNVFSREMNMAARIRHPNLLQFIGATLEGELIILTELMPTSLRAVLERAREPLPHQQISTIALHVARALNYLHLMRPTSLIHRDVSSGNVLLEPRPNDSWKAKLSDYGSVNLLENLRTVGPGSPVYAAPEANIPPLQSPKMDIFSFGVLLVEMCTARFPEVADRACLIRSIQHPDMVALIRRCLAEDRDERPSASDIITELSGPHM